MIELTLGTAVAVVIGMLGAGITLNGFRHAFVDEIALGTVLLLTAWAIVSGVSL
jgi:hypothetical protein